MNETTLIAGEPYTRDELMFKTDPEEYMWQAELTDYVESRYVEELTRCK